MSAKPDPTDDAFEAGLRKTFEDRAKDFSPELRELLRAFWHDACQGVGRRAAHRALADLDARHDVEPLAEVFDRLACEAKQHPNAQTPGWSTGFHQGRETAFVEAAAIVRGSTKIW